MEKLIRVMENEGAEVYILGTTIYIKVDKKVPQKLTGLVKIVTSDKTALIFFPIEQAPEITKSAPNLKSKIIDALKSEIKFAEFALDELKILELEDEIIQTKEELNIYKKVLNAL
jgi:hypothetical protein